MARSYKWDEKQDPRQSKQSAKLKAKEQGKQTKNFWRNVSNSKDN